MASQNNFKKLWNVAHQLNKRGDSASCMTILKVLRDENPVLYNEAFHMDGVYFTDIIEED